MTCTWSEFGKSIFLTKESDVIVLKIGDCILHEGIVLPIRIITFTGKDKKGPIGITYLPWNGVRWATPRVGMHGDPRHIVCEGRNHFGERIPWKSVVLVPNPEKIEYKEEDTIMDKDDW
jgi:hypothetical protein